MNIRAHCFAALTSSLFFELNVEALDSSSDTTMVLMIIDIYQGVLDLPMAFLDGNPFTFDEQTIMNLLVRRSCMLSHDTWEQTWHLGALPGDYCSSSNSFSFHFLS